jgi:hypothetical protein
MSGVGVHGGLMYPARTMASYVSIVHSFRMATCFGSSASMDQSRVVEWQAMTSAIAMMAAAPIPYQLSRKSDQSISSTNEKSRATFRLARLRRHFPENGRILRMTAHFVN